jgi:peptidoglycan/xylan/chitin deacetylase (PgdA/CDA1 family)
MSRVVRLAGLVAAAHLAPALTSLAPVRNRCLPALAGRSGRHHVALTYDDGPDASSTSAFLALLERYDATATFFLLGAHVGAHRGLVREMADRGHEIAVHGWDHRCLAAKRPGALRDDLRRSVDLLGAVTGRRPEWYRPPYGVLTAEGLAAARAAGLRTVLWTTWGRDGTRGATAESVAHRVSAGLRPGGTVLLHDSDRTSAPGSWRATLTASALLLADWAERGLPVGPLGAHW